MSLENPTRLRIGMHGEFAGKDFRLLGRVVMGVEVDGEVYYWNEFNLQTQSGDSATLVYEQTERGGEWRLFTMFEPDYPMTAADAVLKQVGDRLNLNGTDVTVTLVSSSRVYRIEGLPPEAVKVGDVSNYFNAEAGDTMIVADWTGKEIEFYQGLNLSRHAVEAAFNLPPERPEKIFSTLKNLSSAGGSNSGNYSGGLAFVLKAVAILAVFGFIFGRNFSCSMSREAAPVKKLFAAAPPLPLGASGQWEGRNLRITAHAVVEIGEVGVIRERNEYELTDDYGLVTRLVCADTPDAKEWRLFVPLTPLVPPTPQQAAAQKAGDTVNVDGVVATVRELFQSTVIRAENVASSGWHTGDVCYGYDARSEYATLLVLWNSSRIGFFRGKNVLAKDIAAAFSTGQTGK